MFRNSAIISPKDNSSGDELENSFDSGPDNDKILEDESSK